MNGHGEKLTRKQEQAIVALLSNPTLPAAAKAAGVGETTLWRWTQIPEFEKQYREARHQMLAGAIAALQRTAAEAVSTLKAVMSDTTAPASSRVAAARTILDASLKSAELEDLQERIAVLEQRITEQDSSPHSRNRRFP